MEARFASPQTLDSVLLETSPNQPELRLELLGEMAPGELEAVGRRTRYLQRPVFRICAARRSRN